MGTPEYFPKVEDFIKLTPQEVGFLLLQYVSQSDNPSIVNFLIGTLPWISDYVGIHREEFLSVSSEGFSWLESRILLIRKPGDSRNVWYQLSRKAKKLLATGDFDKYVYSDVLQPDSLDQELQKTVIIDFFREDYETAIFKAFKAVEVRVRNLGQYQNSDLGVTLMRKAFHPQKGNLTDQNAEEGEKQAMMDLFAGSIGLFKNPSSHRYLDYDDPVEVAGIIKQADNLLKILQKIDTSKRS